MPDGLTSFEISYKGQRYTDALAGFNALAADLGAAEREFGPVLSTQFKSFLEGVTTALVARHGNPWPGGTGPRSLSKRSGALIESLKNGVHVTGDTLDNVMGTLSGVFYARVHEDGATITPKKGKYLAIPLPSALNADGTPKKSSPREWANTFVIRSKAGNLLICQRSGKNLIPLYVLKTSVKIPPGRLSLNDTIQAGLPAWVDETADRLVKALVSK